jgi:hypothetical protein
VDETPHGYAPHHYVNVPKKQRLALLRWLLAGIVGWATEKLHLFLLCR